MASFTVQQLKTAVAAIPAGANTWLIECPDDLQLPVLTGRSIGAGGTLFYLVRGYINLGQRSWTASP